MKLNKIKKILIASALALTIGLSAACSACGVQTKRPRAKITFEFNSVEYSLEYDLYRNMYPNTVRHFIELAKAGYYNDMIVHDYSSGEWVTGAYSYTAEYAGATGDGGTMSEYFANNSKAADYIKLFSEGKFTPSVYGNTDYKTDKDGNFVYENSTPVRVINKDYALPTVIGEFKKNISQSIKNGALSATSGSLKMIYYPASGSDNASKNKVFVTPTSDQLLNADFKYNSATSVFAMQMGSSTYGADEYCVFGKVRNTDAMDKLKKAVSDYFEDTYGDETYTINAETNVPVYEPTSDGKSYNTKTVEINFKVPKTVIKVISVKITKN